MKQSIIILIGLLMCTNLWAQHRITVKIDGYQNDTCILGYSVGKQTFIESQVFKRDKDGNFVFEGEKTLKGGLYSVLVKPNNEFFQFLISNDEEQKDLKLSSKIKDYPARDLSMNLKVSNSPDNDLFQKYKRYILKMQEKTQKYTKQMQDAKAQKDAEGEAKALKILKESDAEVLAYQDDLLKKYPDFLTPKLVTGGRLPKVPPHLKEQQEILKFYKEHFWDSYDWTDDRLIRTPILKDKMQTYIDRLTVPQVDSVTKACFYMIDQALNNKNKDVFQFIAVQLLNQYAKQKIICMDGVYVSIAQRYYCNGKAHWVDSADVVKICEDAARMAPLRCGKSAPEARLKNIKDSAYVSLYGIKKPFVAVYFWDPTCGNCAKMTKKLIPVYEKYKDRGFEIYGVCSKAWKEVGLCHKKVKEQGMNWINTSDDPYPLAWVKKYYDLRSNPFLYLLDEDKNIMYKRISAEQLDEILEREFKLYEERKKGK